MERNNQPQKPRQKRQKVKREPIGGIRKKSKEPIDYGVTKRQFYEILDKASQSTKDNEQNLK
jgi:hypothetical protein